MMRLLGICGIFSVLSACGVAPNIPPVTFHTSQFIEMKKEAFLNKCRFRVQYIYVKMKCEL